MSILIVQILLSLNLVNAQSCVQVFQEPFLVEGRVVTVEARFVSHDRSAGFDGAFVATLGHPRSRGVERLPTYFGGKHGVQLERRFMEMRYPALPELGDFLLSGRIEEIDGEFFLSLFKIWRKPINYGHQVDQGAKILDLLEVAKTKR